MPNPINIAELPNLDVVYLDNNMLAKEGFTSGLLIIFREYLRRLQEKGFKVGVLSISDQSTSKACKSSGASGLYMHSMDGINIYEYALDHDQNINDAVTTKSILDALLNALKPRLIYTNSAAVFLNNSDIHFLEAANRTGAKVVIVFADELFPTLDKFPSEQVAAYYDQVRATIPICISARIQARLKECTGIKGETFKNTFDPKTISIERGRTLGRYITLVNIHPIKGISIVNEIAQILPDREFLVVRNWQDVPPYVAQRPNITYADFFPTVSDLYRQTKILLVPSLVNEGAARVVIEAMMNGIPVLAHRIGSLPEIVRPYENLIDPPPINGFRMVGSVMYPNISAEALLATAHRFAHRIKEIDSDSGALKDNVNKSRRFALNYARSAEKKFNRQIQRWLGLGPQQSPIVRIIQNSKDKRR